MAFEKGHKKIGGRSKGQINKKTQDLFDKCEKLGVDPFEGLLLIARDGEKEETRLAAYKEICQYLFPKRKAIEMEVKSGLRRIVRKLDGTTVEYTNISEDEQGEGD